MEQICDLETVKSQEIPIKVCGTFYNKFVIEAVYKKQVFLQSLNTGAATRAVLQRKVFLEI